MEIEINEKIDTLLQLEKPFKYDLKLNKKYVGVINNEDLCVICRIFHSTLIFTPEKDDVLYELEEIKEI